MYLLAKYNTQTIFTFPIAKAGLRDFAATGDWTPATGDTKVSKDGGNFANTTNNPAAVGGTGSIGWTLTLTATELSAAVIDIQIVDSATKAVDDQFLKVYTYGNASAKIPFDLSVDLSPRIPAALTANGNIKASFLELITTALTESATGRLKAALTTFLDIASPVFTSASVNQTGDAYARVGAAGAGLSAIPWNAAWDAEVQSEVDDAIVAKFLDKLITGTGTSTNTGGTNTVIDTGKTQADDYWKGQILIPTSGVNIGIARWITDFDALTDTFTVFPAWPNALASGVTYIIVPNYSVWEDRTSEHIAANSTGATLSSIDSNATNLVARITSTLFSGITSLANWLGAAMGKQAPDATAQTEIRARGAGSGTFDPTTDSLEGFHDGVATAAQVSDAVTAEIQFKKNAAHLITFTMYASGTKTPLAGVTVSGQVSKDGGAFASLNGSPAITGISNGYYKVTVAATDFNADNVILRFTGTGCDETSIHIVTQS